jgi:hypothetical protein
MLPFPYKLLEKQRLEDLIKRAHLSSAEKAKLEKVLEQRRQDLKDALLIIEKGLLALRIALNEELPTTTLTLPSRAKKRAGLGARKTKRRKK